MKVDRKTLPCYNENRLEYVKEVYDMGKNDGYPRQCRVCASPNRETIEKWILEDGLGSPTAAKRANEELGENIGHTSIWRHMKNHVMPVKEETIKQYAEKKVKKPEPKEPEEIKNDYQKAVAQAQALAKQNVTEAEKLDFIIEKEHLMYKRAVELMEIQLNEQHTAPRPLTEFIRSCNLNITQAIKTKSEVLGTDAESRKADAYLTWVELMQRVDDDA